ncbi:hypothetical protein [Deinococcus marmoris]|uniref:hypothetical protein n=1 Tax=Deinococcus marmoris TaxID=249408 RepID=UPI0011152F08|nr:hypothetical protein [Deinococcus marmoris]
MAQDKARKADEAKDFKRQLQRLSPGFYVIRITNDKSVILNTQPLHVAWRFMTSSWLMALLIDTAQAFIAAVSITIGSLATTFVIELVSNFFRTADPPIFLISAIGWVGDRAAVITFVWFILGGLALRVREWYRSKWKTGDPEDASPFKDGDTS